jgi:hypothetical protein
MSNPGGSAFVVQIVLPLYDSTGTPFPRESFTRIAADLTARFGGATAYLRSPAMGLWENPSGRVEQDDVVVVEVLVDSIDEAWWEDCRERLETAFRQQTVLIRAVGCRVL